MRFFSQMFDRHWPIGQKVGYIQFSSIVDAIGNPKAADHLQHLGRRWRGVVVIAHKNKVI